MVDQTDVELVRRGYDAFVAGDMEWLNEHLHENIVWHVAGSSTLAGEHRGREEVLAHLARTVQVAVPEFDPRHRRRAGPRIALLRVTWRLPTGDTFQGNAVQVFHVTGGIALESWFIPEDQAGFDRFLAAAPA